MHSMLARHGGFVLLAFLAASGPAFAAAACRAASQTLVLPLVELYTSEGCDSCPPADRWMGSRFPARIGGSGAVALAFHVDYWDRLGWRDRFATHANTERQYAARRENGGAFVYTPQVLVQGRDVPHWNTEADEAINAASQQAGRARIAVDAVTAPREVRLHIVAQVPDAPSRGDAKAFAAYADSGLESEIGAGENRGVRLVHAHVVRAFREVGGFDATGSLDTRISLDRPAEAGTDPTLVVFVQRMSNGDVLQTLALSLEACTSRQCTTCASSPER